MPDPGRWSQLFELICADRRETDIAARLGDGLFAILLLDTNEDGAKAYSRKIVRQAKGMAVSTIAQTHPGHLFANLVSGEPDPSEFQTVLVDEGTAPKGRRSVPAALSAAKERWLGILGIALD